MTVLLCITCNKPFTTYPSRIKIGKGKFCSKTCDNQSRIGHTPTYTFPKGNIPWSKGLKRPDITGCKHPLWKGDQVSYTNLHQWVKRHRGTPSECDRCGTTEKRRYEWANISREYKRELSDWVRLCVPCHRTADIQNLKLPR